jgi:hypothetical protein
MQIEILNPTFGRRDDRQTRGSVPFPRLSSGDAVRVAFIDNEKPNTTDLLEKVAAGLAERFTVESVHLLKGGAAHPAPAEVLTRAADVADLAVLATAD